MSRYVRKPAPNCQAIWKSNRGQFDSASKVRNLREHGLQDGVSTRLLIYAGQLMASGLAPRIACQSGFVQALTDDGEVEKSLQEVVEAIFPE
jgi:nitric oxide reductase NorQ protein